MVPLPLPVAETVNDTVAVHVEELGAQAGPEAQSPSSTQPCPAPHASGQGPPQSTPDSGPFWAPSAQLGAAQWPPTSHALLAHWDAVVHGAPTGQAAQPLPPQSMAASALFFTPWVQVPSTHAKPMHTRSVQSPAMRQVSPAPQGAQFGPPQSMSVSPPSRVPFRQSGPTQT